VLAGGKIIERGTHTTLLAQSGFYANLVEEVDRD
jgi:ABC-type multidrug transport system fused ATPase/permease subunit